MTKIEWADVTWNPIVGCSVFFAESQWQKPHTWRSPKKIFACSMSDLFHENVPDEWIDKVFAVAAIAAQPSPLR